MQSQSKLIASRRVFKLHFLQLPLIVIVLLSSDLIANAQTDLRLFGTNLFDFSPLASTADTVPYRLRGKVSQVYSNSVRITCIVGVGFVYSPPSWGEIQNSGPGDLLTQLYVQQRAQQGNMSVGEVLSMGENARQFLQPVKKSVDLYLLNYPTKVSIGSEIDCFALPTSTKGFWDYGNPFSGNVSQFKFIYRVRPTGIVSERQYSAEEKREMKQSADDKTVVWLLSQATNGSASAQCSLGLRYLDGRGVESNKTLAIKWLKYAADQGDVEASNKLLRITKVSP